MAIKPSSFPSKVPNAPQLASPSNVIPGAGQSWGTYWTVVVGMSCLMFLFFLAANGLLTQWLNLFIFATPKTESTTGSGSPTSTGLNTATSALGSAASALPGAAGSVLGTIVGGPAGSAIGGAIGSFF